MGLTELNDVEKLKAFLLWCKKQKIASVEVGGIKAQFAPIAFLETPKPAARKKSAEPVEPDIDPRTGYPVDDLYAASG